MKRKPNQESPDLSTSKTKLVEECLSSNGESGKSPGPKRRREVDEGPPLTGESGNSPAPYRRKELSESPGLSGESGNLSPGKSSGPNRRKEVDESARLTGEIGNSPGPIKRKELAESPGLSGESGNLCPGPSSGSSRRKEVDESPLLSEESGNSPGPSKRNESDGSPGLSEESRNLSPGKSAGADRRKEVNEGPRLNGENGNLSPGKSSDPTRRKEVDESPQLTVESRNSPGSSKRKELDESPTLSGESGNLSPGKSAGPSERKEVDEGPLLNGESGNLSPGKSAGPNRRKEVDESPRLTGESGNSPGLSKRKELDESPGLTGESENLSPGKSPDPSRKKEIDGSPWFIGKTGNSPGPSKRKEVYESLPLITESGKSPGPGTRGKSLGSSKKKEFNENLRLSVESGESPGPSTRRRSPVRAKRELIYDSPGVNGNGNDSPGVNGNSCSSAHLDYDPVVFLRCHSRNNDAADVQTQVWQCAFEPDAHKRHQTTSIVATCGGNSVCFIDVTEGSVVGKYYSDDQKEMFCTLTWSSIRKAGEDRGNRVNILAVAGAKNVIHLIHPEKLVAFLKITLKTSCKMMINYLHFHPLEPNILFCAGSTGDIIVFDIGSPLPPDYTPKATDLCRFTCNSEIISLAFSAETSLLLAACSEGLVAWKIDSRELRKQIKTTDKFQMIEFVLPENSTRPCKLVDSIEVLESGLVAIKCALSGKIYVWNLKEALRCGTTTVVPTYTLIWNDTDNYFMNMGYHSGAGVLACGDDKGALWLYDMHDLFRHDNLISGPTVVLAWPNVEDVHAVKRRKLSLDVYDIIVDKVAVNHDGSYMVAVTNNNMVCIWRRVK